jgi:hypothetical protein
MCRPMAIAVSVCSLLGFVAGCTTTRTTDTARTGMEQLLISNAVDQALDKYDFQAIQGKSVFIEEKYLDSVDKGYLLSSIRERILYNGGRIAAKAEDSDVTLEIRSGSVGTDNLETFVGIPNMSVPGILPIEIPDVKVWNRTSQMGTAKLGILAYETKSGTLYQHGGQALARSDDTKWFVMGLGPFQSGTVKTEVQSSAASPTALARAIPRYPSTYVANRPDALSPPLGVPESPMSPAGSPIYPAAYPTTYR